jgi:HPt (histidine-containing phosphotransfer) domain-containing protein
MASTIDPDVIQELLDIMEDEFDVLLETYLVDAVLKFETLDSAIVSGDKEQLREAAHSLKGSSSNIGAIPLSGLCSNIETLARENQIDEAKTIIRGAHAEFGRVRTELENRLSH